MERKAGISLSILAVVLLAALLLVGCSGRTDRRQEKSEEIESARTFEVTREDSLKLARMAKERDSRKVVLIGLDGTSWNILDPMIEQGLLPTFKKLLGSSSFGHLRSVEFFVTPPGWAAMFTGCMPWKNGIYGFGKLDTTSRELIPTSSLDIQVPMIWDMVSQAGLRTAVINVPLTYPARKVNGIMVTGMLTPGQVPVKKVIKINGGLKEASSADLGKYGVTSYSPSKRTDIKIYDSSVTAYLLDTTNDGRLQYDKLLVAVQGEKARRAKANGSSDSITVTIPDQIVSCPLDGYTPWVKILINKERSPERGWVRLGGELVGRSLLRVTCTPVYGSLPETNVKFCYPDSLKEAIAGRFERFIPFVSYVIPTIPDLVDDIAEYLDFFYSYDAWDLFIFQFQVTDVIHHWDGDGELTQEVYRKIDKILEELIAGLPDNATLIIASDHGGREYKFKINLNVWLDQLGLLAKTRRGELDYKNSIAYHMGWGIFINKQELNQRWRVIPGFHPPERVSLYDAFIDYLIEKGRAMQFPDSNRPMPVEIRRCPAERIEPAPDLVVRAEYSNYAIQQEDIFQMEKNLVFTPFEEGKKFSHRRAGMFLISGKGVKKGFKCKAKNIYDITPTILYLMGLPVADYFDGVVIEGIFEEDFLASHIEGRIRSYHYVRAEGGGEDLEREKLEEKLRAIGYVQ